MLSPEETGRLCRREQFNYSFIDMMCQRIISFLMNSKTN